MKKKNYMTPLQTHLTASRERFRQKFGGNVWIGADRNVVESFLLSEQKSLLEAVEKEIKTWEKEQLDKNNPDNYGACYAIGGFNDAISKILALLREGSEPLPEEK